MTSAARIGTTLSLDDLAETYAIGDWKMPRLQGGPCICGEPGLADRRGRCGDAHHGGAGGGIAGFTLRLLLAASPFGGG